MTAATPLPSQVLRGPDPDLRAAHGPESGSSWETDDGVVFVIGTALFGAPGAIVGTNSAPV